MPWHFILYNANPHPGKEKAERAARNHGGRVHGYFEDESGSKCAALIENGNGRAMADELRATKKFLDIDES